jgi:hypothetical protein
MSANFSKLYDDIRSATRHLHDLKECNPHYQRVLEYIQTHPEEHDEIAAALIQNFDIYLLQFLMPTLKWPEVRIAAEQLFNDGGNHFHDNELKRLLEIYDGN